MAPRRYPGLSNPRISSWLSALEMKTVSISSHSNVAVNSPPGSSRADRSRPRDDKTGLGVEGHGALDGPDDGPGQVVVDHEVRVLQVLAFGEDVGGDEDVDRVGQCLGVGLAVSGQLVRLRREAARHRSRGWCWDPRSRAAGNERWPAGPGLLSPSLTAWARNRRFLPGGRGARRSQHRPRNWTGDGWRRRSTHHASNFVGGWGQAAGGSVRDLSIVTSLSSRRLPLRRSVRRSYLATGSPGC